MPIDSSIYSRFAPEAKSLQDYKDEGLLRESRQQSIASNRLAMQGQQQAFEEKQRATQEAGIDRNMLQRFAQESGGDMAKLSSALRGSGRAALIGQGAAMEKSAIDGRKAESATLAQDVESENKVIASYRDMIGMVSDPQAAAQMVTLMHSDPRLKNTPMARVPLEQGLAQIGQDPQSFAAWKQQFGLGASKYIEQNKPQYVTQNLGGTSQITALPGLGGQGTVASSSPITQSRDSVASNETQRRGQDKVDARARDANTTQKLLVNQERQLKVDELQDKADQRTRQKQGAIASVEAQLGVIDKAIKHPGRATSTGLSGTLDPRNYVPGTDATDFRAVLDQIGGAAFLQAFEALKGGGAITEVEGKKATDAVARLNRAQSDEEFAVGLKDLRKVMTDGYKRLSGKDYAGAEDVPVGKPSQVKDDAGYNALPSGALFVGPDGKTRRKP